MQNGQYSIDTSIRYGPGKLMDIQGLISANSEGWLNFTLCRVNDCVARLGLIEGVFHWHRHEEEDEFFYVVQGELVVELEGSESVTLKPSQGYVVPRGVTHRTRAPVRTAILMFEGAGVTPMGD
jgi:mannose-6-phosphate isomerase-like protein (cupin superfamily)